jgi:hypothetical protein
MIVVEEEEVVDDQSTDQLRLLTNQLEVGLQHKQDLWCQLQTNLERENELRAKLHVESVRINSTSAVLYKIGERIFKISFFLMTALVLAIPNDGLNDDKVNSLSPTEDSASTASEVYLTILLTLQIISFLELSYWIPLIFPISSHAFSQIHLCFWMLAVDSMGIAATVLSAVDTHANGNDRVYLIVIAAGYWVFVCFLAKFQMMWLNHLMFLTPVGYVLHRIAKLLEFLYPDYFLWRIMAWEFYWDFQVAILEVDNTGITANRMFVHTTANQFFL